MEGSRTPVYTVQASKFGPGPPHVRIGPLEWDPNPLRMGSGPPAMGSQSPRTELTLALNRTQVGVRYRHVSRPSLVRTCPHTLLLPAQAETRRKTVVELFPDSPAAAGFRALAEKMLLHGPGVVPVPMEENALEELCRY